MFTDSKEPLIIAAAKRSVRFAVLKNVRVYIFEDILKKGRNALISGSLVLVFNVGKLTSSLTIS